MKSVATTLLAGLMVLGTIAAVATPKPISTTNHQVAAIPGDGSPMPTCYPTDPNCTPPIPPAVK